MKIVGVAACTSGIAHTYIAKQKSKQLRKNLVMKSISKPKEPSGQKVN